MVMTSVWLHAEAVQTFGKVLEKRFEVGHGFGANDEKELKILHRTIKIDAE